MLRPSAAARGLGENCARRRRKSVVIENAEDQSRLAGRRGAQGSMPLLQEALQERALSERASAPSLQSFGLSFEAKGFRAGQVSSLWEKIPLGQFAARPCGYAAPEGVRALSAFGQRPSRGTEELRGQGGRPQHAGESAA